MYSNILDKIGLQFYNYPQEFNEYYEEIMPQLPFMSVFFNDNVMEEKPLDALLTSTSKENLNSPNVHEKKEILLFTSNITLSVKRKQVGIYTSEERKNKIKRWKDKKSRLTIGKVRYISRKVFANTRPRKGGRFIRKFLQTIP